MPHPANHPLRLCHIRLLQARLCVHLTRIEVDPELGGDPKYLNRIEEAIELADHELAALAAAERIDLTNPEDE